MRAFRRNDHFIAAAGSLDVVAQDPFRSPVIAGQPGAVAVGGIEKVPSRVAEETEQSVSLCLLHSVSELHRPVAKRRNVQLCPVQRVLFHHSLLTPVFDSSTPGLRSQTVFECTAMIVASVQPQRTRLLGEIFHRQRDGDNRCDPVPRNEDAFRSSAGGNPGQKNPGCTYSRWAASRRPTSSGIFLGFMFSRSGSRRMARTSRLRLPVTEASTTSSMMPQCRTRCS